MKEKNNVFLMIVAVVALVVTVGGAAYAYFASSIKPGAGLNLDVEAQASIAQFTATGGNFGFTVTGAEMQQSNVSYSEPAKSSQIDMRVSLNSTTYASCTFDIKFAWDEGSVYTPTKELGTYPVYENGEIVEVLEEKEFTINVSGEYGNCPTEDCGPGTPTVEPPGENIDRIFSDFGGYVIAGAKIVTTGGETHFTYTMEVNVYNLPHDQSALAGNGTKTYSGRFYVDNVVC